MSEKNKYLLCAVIWFVGATFWVLTFINGYEFGTSMVTENYISLLCSFMFSGAALANVVYYRNARNRGDK